MNLADSSSYGNYSGTKADTGTTTKAKTNNIYDMAGNVWEITQEANAYSGRIERGGHYNNNGVNGTSYPITICVSDSPDSANRYGAQGTRPVYIINP